MVLTQEENDLLTRIGAGQLTRRGTPAGKAER